MLKSLIRQIPNEKFAFVVGVGVFISTLLGTFLIGRIYSATQARIFIEAVLPSVRTLSFAVITSSSTVIALMITMVSFAHRMDSDFDKQFYLRVQLIAVLGTIGLISATLLLVLLSIPITESDELSVWYQSIYWIIMTASAWIAGILVSLISLLYQALEGLIDVFTPELNL